MLVADAKIIIIIPYFGQWPFWINFFIRSCALNPKIDWLIYTDCGLPDVRADNVTIKSMSFDDYQQLVSERLNISFAARSAYKLCDLKPALGFIHTEDITGYDFWGFGDIDLIYGQVFDYLTDAMLQKQLISFHAHRISGHLCLLRNNSRMRQAFMRYKGWREILEDSEHRCFDEKQFNSLFIRHKNWPRWLRSIIYYPRYLMRNAWFQECYSTNNLNVPWVDGSLTFPENWYWQGGLLCHDGLAGQEHVFPYLHFLAWKKQWGSNITDGFLPVTGDYWKVNQTGIFCIDEDNQ